MFDFLFSNSYIDVKYEGRKYLSESYSQLDKMMHDSNSSITVHVYDFTGMFTDVKTYSKSDIEYYGS